MAYFLCTERLGFRHWSDSDFELAMAHWGDPEVTRLIDLRTPLGPEQVQERLDTEIANQRFYGMQYWPMFALEDGSHVGCCGLRPRAKRVHELGFHVRSRLWRNGYAFEAARAVAAYAFDALGASELVAGHHPRNAASRRVLEKLGFEFVREEFYAPTGLRHPSYVLRAK